MLTLKHTLSDTQRTNRNIHKHTGDNTCCLMKINYSIWWHTLFSQYFYVSCSLTVWTFSCDFAVMTCDSTLKLLATWPLTWLATCDLKTFTVTWFCHPCLLSSSDWRKCTSGCEEHSHTVCHSFSGSQRGNSHPQPAHPSPSGSTTHSSAF